MIAKRKNALVRKETDELATHMQGLLQVKYGRHIKKVDIYTAAMAFLAHSMGIPVKNLRTYREIVDWLSTQEWKRPDTTTGTRV